VAHVEYDTPFYLAFEKPREDKRGSLLPRSFRVEVADVDRFSDPPVVSIRHVRAEIEVDDFHL
jgi:hypothetical protein